MQFSTNLHSICTDICYNGDMAVNQLINTDIPPNIRVYKNGALYDKDKGRIVGVRPELAEKNTQITKANSGDLLAKRLENKRARLMAGANSIVAKGGDYDGTDLDFVEAIGEAVTLAALDPTSSQQVKAAEFLFREAGIGERQAVQDGAGGTIGALADVIGALSAFAGSIAQLSDSNANYHNQPGSVVDADVLDADSVAHDDTVQAGDTDNGSE